MRIIASTFIIAALAVLGGCQSGSKVASCKCDPCTCSSPCPCTSAQASLGIMNDTCPMSGRPVNNESPNASWNGQSVGFCCGGCKSRFEAADDNGKSEMLANAK
ncbi:MAG: hypothetical protein MK089_07410 [Phycisphaerales bacterium]|nr:hypothetical protein [Phycisphaerales bacterium]